MDNLLTPWVMVRASHLLSWWGIVGEDPGTAGDGPMEEGAATAEPLMGQDMDTPVFMRENVRLGPRYWSARSNHSLGKVPMSW